MSYTCIRCERTSHHPEDEKWQWCAHCQRFGFAADENPVVALNAVVSETMKPVRGRLASGSPYSLQFELFDVGKRACWRCFVKVGQTVWAASSGEHLDPTSALRELAARIREMSVVQNG